MPSIHAKPTALATSHEIRINHDGDARSAIGRALMSIAFALTIGSVGITAAQAEPGFGGQFSGRGEGRVSMTVTPVQGQAPGTSYQISADTAIRNVCTGAVAGLARPNGSGRLQLRTRSESGEICTLDLTYSADRCRVVVEETGCGDFHGTSCAFSARLTRR